MGSLADFDNHYIDSAKKNLNEEGIHFIGAVMEDRIGKFGYMKRHAVKLPAHKFNITFNT